MNARQIYKCWFGLGALAFFWSTTSTLARAETYQASSGAVEAIVTEKCLRRVSAESCAEFEQYIKITRTGDMILEGRISSDEFDRVTNISIQDLDGDNEAEIIVDFLASPFYKSIIYGYRQGLHQYFPVESFWGRRPGTLKDLNGDSIPEFVSFNSSVGQAFSAPSVGRAYPLQIWRYIENRMIDVTTQYPQQIKDDAFSKWQSFRQVGIREDGSEDSLLSAYFADKYLLGEAEDAWQRIAANYPGSTIPTAVAERIRGFLEQGGYTLIPQGTQNAQERSRFGIVESKTEGALGSSSPVLRDGSRYGTHTFSGEASQVVSIDLGASFDTYLILLDSNGNKIAENDDADSSDRNSRIQIILPRAGQYRILANSYDASGTGSYWLTMRSTVNTARLGASSHQASAQSQQTRPVQSQPSSSVQSQQPTAEARSLLITSNPRSTQGVDVPLGEREERVLSGYGFFLDRRNAQKMSDGTAVYSLEVYNLGYADGVVEVYDSTDNLVEIRGISGIRNPASDIYAFPIESISRLWRLFTEGYGFMDLRNAVGRTQRTEIKNIAIPPGGRIIFTKSSDAAMHYNQATFIIEALAGSISSRISASDNLIFREKLLLSLYLELQKEQVGNLVQDGMFLTIEDSQRAFNSQSWYKEEILEKMMAIGAKVLAQESLKYGVERTVVEQLVLGKQISFWIDAAEAVAKGSNIYLQWWDLKHSRAEEISDGQSFGIRN
jgi:hypothetical protein